MGVAQLTYEPQLQTTTGLTAGQEHVNLLKHVKHGEDAIHIFTPIHITRLSNNACTHTHGYGWFTGSVLPYLLNHTYSCDQND